jgi:hypothetical protein
MTKQTRYKISVSFGLFLLIIVFLSIFKGTQNIGVAAITAVITILSSYIWGETKRPSKKN